MAHSSKHFLRTAKRLAKKKALRNRKRTRKCACKSKKHRGGSMDPMLNYPNATVTVRMDDMAPVLRSVGEVMENVNPYVDVSYDQNTGNNKKLNNLRPENVY